MSLIYEYAPIVALLVFFAAFLWIAYRAYRPSAKNKLQEHAFIPLKGDSNE